MALKTFMHDVGQGIMSGLLVGVMVAALCVAFLVYIRTARTMQK